MTKKDKKEKHIDNTKQLTEDKNKLEASEEVSSNVEEHAVTIEKEEEVKLLEGEDQKVLDYFSKDDLVGKIK
ncbi:MAG: hypothetical protein ACFFC1_09620, partial [Promethearchaeota archaeon]